MSISEDLFFEVVVIHSPFSSKIVSPSKPSLGLFAIEYTYSAKIVANIPATKPPIKIKNFFIFVVLLNFLSVSCRSSYADTQRFWAWRQWRKLKRKVSI